MTVDDVIYFSCYQFEFFSLPWNQEKLFGWIAVMMCGMMISLFFYTINGVFLLFLIGIGEHNRAFFYQFRDMLVDSDENFIGGRVNIEKSLRDLINFHISIRE